MFVPFTTKCGHNFCYECLSSWFATRLSCPTCRAPVDDIPYYNIFAQQMLESLMEIVSKSMVSRNEDESIVEIVDKNDIYSNLPEYIRRDRDLKMKQYKKDLKNDNLFKKMFKIKRTAVIDLTDGVARCSNCHWEVTGTVCENCHLELRNPYYDSEEDEDYEEYDEEYGDHLYGHRREIRSEDESEFSDDSFIDDGPIRESEGDYDDGLSSDSSSPVRRDRYRLTDLESISDDSDSDREENNYGTWNGFNEDDDDHVIEVNNALREEIVLDSDDDMPAQRRRRSNIITISDDE